MANCKQLIQKIKSGDKGLREAIEEMYKDADFQKSAKYFYKKYPVFQGIIDWEDLLIEAIVRFIDNILSRKDEIRNCNAFFFRICSNYSLELWRKLRPPKGTLPDNPIDPIFIAIRPYIDKLSTQCQLLLYLIYFHRPPYDPKDREELARILREHGYNLQPENIPAVIARCKRNLIDLIQGDLDNFEGFDV